MKGDANAARILYLCGGRSFFSINPGRKLAEVAECWRRAGHDVNHICGGDILGGHVSTAEAQDYGSQRTYSRWYRNTPGIAPLVTSVSEWRDIQHDNLMLEHLRTVCGDWRPDVIWERSSRLHHAGLTLAQELGAPYVLEWKDHLVDYRFSLWCRKALRIEAQKNRDAGHIVVESRVLRDELEHHGVDISKIIIAYNAVKLDEFSRNDQTRVQIRQDLGVNDDIVLVGYLGSYAFYHDAAQLVQAAQILRRSDLGSKLKVLMVGAGKEYSMCKKLAADFGILGNFIIMRPGVPKDEVAGILSALDIAVLPGSTDIICPIKVQEYMACGLPSVVPDYACNREVVDDNRTGILFRPKSGESLAEKISLLAEDDLLRQRIGGAALSEVKRRFTWEKTWGAAMASVIDRTRFAQKNETATASYRCD